MAITDDQKRRLNESMPVANDLKIGDIIQELQESGGTAGLKAIPVKGDPEYKRSGRIRNQSAV